MSTLEADNMSTPNRRTALEAWLAQADALLSNQKQEGTGGEATREPYLTPRVHSLTVTSRGAWNDAPVTSSPTIREEIGSATV